MDFVKVFSWIIVIALLSCQTQAQSAAKLQSENIKLQLKISELEGKITSQKKAIKKLREKFSDKSRELRKLKKLCDDNGIAYGGPVKSKSTSLTDKIKQKIELALGESNRGHKNRVATVDMFKNSLGQRVIYIQWSINDKGSDAAELNSVIGAIRTMKLRYHYLAFEATDIHGDKFGNSHETIVFNTILKSSDIAKINWANFSPGNFGGLDLTKSDAKAAKDIMEIVRSRIARIQR